MKKIKFIMLALVLVTLVGCNFNQYIPSAYQPEYKTLHHYSDCEDNYNIITRYYAKYKTIPNYDAGHMSSYNKGLDWQKIYREVLYSYKKIMSYDYSGQIWAYHHFALVDFDGDDIPELIIFSEPAFSFSLRLIAAYSLNGDELYAIDTSIFPEWGGFGGLTLLSDGRIMSFLGGADTHSFSVLSIENNKLLMPYSGLLQLISVWIEEKGASFPEIIYSINSEEVTEEYFNDFFELWEYSPAIGIQILPITIENINNLDF